MGAIDVCSFVPVANVTMEECVICSEEFGRRLSSDLGVPVFLYAEAQAKDYRKALSDIRHGEYEGLEMKVGSMRVRTSDMGSMSDGGEYDWR